MKLRNTVSFFLLILSLSLVQGKQSSPNIVLIMADDMGYECIGAHGGTSYETPRIDKLADEGMLFEQCHAQAICTPSRVKIMTGTSNVVNYIKFGKLDRKLKTFAHYFQEAGYATGIMGKWQLGQEDDSPIHFGFDEAYMWRHSLKSSVEGFNGDNRDSRFASPWMQHTQIIEGKIESKTKQYPYKYGPDLSSDFACDFIEKNKDKPFLLYYPMALVHCPFDSTPDSEDWESNNLGSLTYKGDEKYFADMMAYTDKIVGKIVDKLEALDLRENTLIIFTGDNGTDKPIVSNMGDTKIVGSKGKPIEWGTHVPFVASWPREIPPNSKNSDLIDFSDVLPTMCAAAGIEVPNSPELTGISFLPQLMGEKGSPREWLYCWYHPREKNPVTVFSRSLNYKLYNTGKFFNISKDVLEKNPLEESDLSEVAWSERKKLQDVLDRFEDLEINREKNKR
tara:strand:+ start:4024 stop:5376 length:1353 start_codon:yes stop_codon:yes gene_type:complete